MSDETIIPFPGPEKREQLRRQKQEVKSSDQALDYLYRLIKKYPGTTLAAAALAAITWHTLEKAKQKQVAAMQAELTPGKPWWRIW